ncbi:hypothetical protein H920_06365 [Fukomys damarensis]|uniref:Uncharacterized protein n=1 Tax=Fukomys damarensis TaxID=885580 RepID=A0A091DMG7_FUKDA|nr:hypothetical protein H920_06365 [Fukomys damarensis]
MIALTTSGWPVVLPDDDDDDDAMYNSKDDGLPLQSLPSALSLSLRELSSKVCTAPVVLFKKGPVQFTGEVLLACVRCWDLSPAQMNSAYSFKLSVHDVYNVK